MWKHLFQRIDGHVRKNWINEWLRGLLRCTRFVYHTPRWQINLGKLREARSGENWWIWETCAFIYHLSGGNYGFVLLDVMRYWQWIISAGPLCYLEHLGEYTELNRLGRVRYLVYCLLQTVDPFKSTSIHHFHQDQEFFLRVKEFRYRSIRFHFPCLISLRLLSRLQSDQFFTNILMFLYFLWSARLLQ